MAGYKEKNTLDRKKLLCFVGGETASRKGIDEFLSQLDFIHWSDHKRQDKVMSIFPDEGRGAQLARRNDGFLGAVCAVVYALGLVPCPGVGDWGSVGAWETHNHGDFVGDGAAPESALAERDSRQRLKGMEPTGYESSCENDSARGGLHAQPSEEKWFGYPAQALHCH